MNDKQRNELDTWLWQNVLGAKLILRKADGTYPTLKYLRFPTGDEVLERMFAPTTDPAAAMQVLEKCLTRTSHIEIDFEDGVYHIMEAHESTLALAICLFAKQLFSR